MRARTILPCLFALSVIITGCPFSTDIPFSDKSTADKIDNTLIGTWKNSQSGVEANEVVITKGEVANTYKIIVSEPGSEFDAKTKSFTGWITTLKTVRFLVLQGVLPSGPTDEYYLYTIESAGKKLITSHVTIDAKIEENADTMDQYQKYVLKYKDLEDFLRGEIVWIKN